MITVHHLNNSRSQRIVWLLEELSLPYEIRHYQRDANTMLAPSELKIVHPLGKSPVITDDSHTIAESAVIITYLLDRYGKGRLRPAPDSPDALAYLYWLHFAEGSAMPPLLLSLVLSRLGEKPVPWPIRPIGKILGNAVIERYVKPTLKLQYDYMQSVLEESPWFAGELFTAADIQMSFPLEAARSRGMIDDRWPAIQNWLQRIHARPTYQSALDAAGASAS